MSVTALPSADEREWLIDRMAALMAAAGWQRLVNAPMIEPADRYFPDRWTADAAGVRRMALRLLRFAGLGHLDVAVHMFEGESTSESDGRRSSERHAGAAAWFAGVADGVVQFGSAEHGLADPAGLTGTMSHEVAHVFRRVHGLEVEDRDEEERLTDLTTIWLGFGVLTTNATLKHRSHGGFDGQNFYNAYSWQSVGYLPPQAMAFLLAVQACARGLEAADRRFVAGLLETNQAAWFTAACKWLTKEVPDLRARLGLPDPSTWPAPDELAPLLGPLAHADREVEADDEEATEAVALDNRGEPVFRVIRTRAPMFVGLTLGVLLLAVPVTVVRAELPVAPTLAAAAVLVSVAYTLGRRRRRDCCSDPRCEAALTAGVRVCPGCHGDVVGTIADPSQRLDALERHRERARQIRLPS